MHVFVTFQLQSIHNMNFFIINMHDSINLTTIKLDLSQKHDEGIETQRHLVQSPL